MTASRLTLILGSLQLALLSLLLSHVLTSLIISVIQLVIFIVVVCLLVRDIPLIRIETFHHGMKVIRQNNFVLNCSD